jgi:hypothetical protein
VKDRRELHVMQVLLSSIQLPDGFSVSVFAQNISFARALDISPSGTVFVSTFNFLNISGLFCLLSVRFALCCGFALVARLPAELSCEFLQWRAATLKNAAETRLERRPLTVPALLSCHAGSNPNYNQVWAVQVRSCSYVGCARRTLVLCCCRLHLRCRRRCCSIDGGVVTSRLSALLVQDTNGDGVADVQWPVTNVSSEPALKHIEWRRLRVAVASLAVSCAVSGSAPLCARIPLACFRFPVLAAR